MKGEFMPTEKYFKVALSADFLDEDRHLIFPDIGLSLLDSEPVIDYKFVADYRPEYVPEQLAGVDVLISLKPRVTAASLQGIEQLCAIGRCGVGYDNVDLVACTEHDIAVYITPAGVVRPIASSIVLLVLALSHNLVLKDRMMREGPVGGEHPPAGARTPWPHRRDDRLGRHCQRGGPPAPQF